MCINPSILPNGVAFGCRKCWQCCENRVQDWVGRCIAQSKTSTETYSTTLTYGGGDHVRATVLTYSDVQKYFKRLRKAGYKFKYLCAGEYGSTKGRAHWHLILFFEGDAPPHKLRENFHDPFWPHGFSFWDEPNPPALRYVCKYLQKNEDDPEAYGMFRMSKKPPIGSEYFAQRAQMFVDAHLAPQNLKYKFDENKNTEGTPVIHYMHGATARDFLTEYVTRWHETHKNNLWPNSDLVDEFIDKNTILAPTLQLPKRTYGVIPTFAPTENPKFFLHEPTNRYYSDGEDGRRWWWKPLEPDDLKGEHAWQNGPDAVRWEQSPRYKYLVAKAQAAKAQRDADLRQTSPASGATASQAFPRSQDRPGKLRLPMVGDGW